MRAWDLTDTEMTKLQLQERVALLEARVKRIANERNAARASFSRLAKVSEPFANQTSRSFRHWLDSVPTDVVFRLSKSIHTTLTDDKPHHMIFQIMKTSENLAVALDESRDKQDTKDEGVILLTDRLLSQFDKLHEWDT